eukprot:4760_1
MADNNKASGGDDEKKDEIVLKKIDKYPESLSWNVPRISLPQALGPMDIVKGEWWFYVGYVKDVNNDYYSIQANIIRVAIDKGISLGFQILGIGEAKSNKYYWSKPATGAFSGEVSDRTFSVSLKDLVNKGLIAKYEYLGNAIYSVNKSGPNFGACPGMIGGTYNLMHDCSTSNMKCNLYLEDKRGSVLEGYNGIVGASYEFNQPKLEIITNNKKYSSTINLGSGDIQIIEGNLSNDRQMMFTGSFDSSTDKSDKKLELDHMSKTLIHGRGKKFTRMMNIGAQKNNAKQYLYVGHWILLILNDGTNFSIVNSWKKQNPQQWQACSATNAPPDNSYALKYDKYDNNYLKAKNGGSMLHGFPILTDNQILDFECNILIPSNPELSPQWQSQYGPKHTYATAWTINMNGFWKKPTFYLFAMCDECENTLTDAYTYWEGAVKIYSDAQKKNLVGFGWVEQFGCN